MANRLLQFFKYEHLPSTLQDPSRSCSELAMRMDLTLPEGAEKTAGLRKLLEAKDCFVRALVDASSALERQSVAPEGGARGKRSD